MSLTVVDARLDVYKPTNDSDDPNDADTQVPGTDIEFADVPERLQDEIDQGIFELEDNGASYVGSITSGDRVRWFTHLEGDDNHAYGEDAYGEGAYGGMTRRWTGMVRTPTPEETGRGTQKLKLNVDDFVFGVLDIRTVTNGFEDDDISGSSNAILDTIIANNAGELDTDQIEDVNTTASVSWASKKLLEAVKELSERGDALVGQNDKSLIFKRLSAPAVTATLKDSDRGLARAPKDDDSLYNEIRVDGGDDTNIDDEQTTQSSTTTVTDSNRITHQLDVSKSEVTLVEVYTKTTGSGDNVVVRIHPDNGSGSPIDVTDREQDFGNRTLASDFLADDGFTTFIIPEHTLGPKHDPHLIIESDGSTGQDIGTDGGGTPTYKAHYPFRLATVVRDDASITENRRRETSLRAPDADTKSQTEQRGNAALRHRSEPARELEFPAESPRAHGWKPGDIISVDEPHLDASGDYIVMGRHQVYDAGRNELTTDLLLQDVDTV